MTGLAPDFAAENVGFSLRPDGQRAKTASRPSIAQQASSKLTNGVTVPPSISGARLVTAHIGESAEFQRRGQEPIAIPATQQGPWRHVRQEPLPTGDRRREITAAVMPRSSRRRSKPKRSLSRGKAALIAERYAEGAYAQDHRRLVHGQERLRQRSWHSGQRRASILDPPAPIP